MTLFGGFAALHPRPRADRCHRQQAGAELLPDGLRRGEPGGARPDACACPHAAAHALVCSSCSITKKQKRSLFHGSTPSPFPAALRAGVSAPALAAGLLCPAPAAAQAQFSPAA
ncbi:hypothetical protein ACU4GD_27495 [Cupriavidus basilensis]